MKFILIALALASTAVAETVTLMAVQDSDIYAFFDGPSFSVFDLNVGASGEAMAHSHHALVQFDLSGVGFPAAEIGSALLRLYVLEPGSANGGGLRSGDVAIHRQGAAWSVAGLKWSHLQPQESLGVVPVTEASVDTWVELDITALVKAWASGEQPNHGMVLKPESETLEPWLNVLFASMEIGNFAPQLEITRAEEAPVLSVSASGGQIVVEWPVAAGAGWVLQETDDLAGEWIASTATASEVDDKWRVVRAPGPSGRGFFRLFRP